VDKVVAGSVV